MRNIPISSKLYELLKPLKNNFKGQDYLLSGTDKAIEPRCYQNVFKKILKKNI